MVMVRIREEKIVAREGGSARGQGGGGVRVSRLPYSAKKKLKLAQ